MSVASTAIKVGKGVVKGVKRGAKVLKKGVKKLASLVKKGVKKVFGSKPKGELYKKAGEGSGVISKIKETIDKGKVAVRDLMNPMVKGKEKVLGKGANQPKPKVKVRTGTGQAKVPYEPPIKGKKKKPIVKKALNEGLGAPNPLLRSKL